MVDIEKLLDKPLLRNLRAAVATIRAVSFILVVLGTTITLAIVAGRSSSARPGLAAALAVVVVLLLVTTSYAAIYVTRSYDPPFYEILELDADLEVYKVDNHHRYVYVRKQKVKATRNGVRLFELRAHFTGGGSSEN